ncbi:HEAT repeat domain-containing protein [Planctomycetota bacterium]
MMKNSKAESSEIVEIASKRVGTFAGKAAAIGRKIAELRGRDISVNMFTPSTNEKNGFIPEVFALEPDAEEHKARKLATKALVAALESDLTIARCQLEQTRDEAEKVQSHLTKQIKNLKTENKTLASDLKQAQSKASKTSDQKDSVAKEAIKLKSNLAAAERKLNKLQSEADKQKSDFLSQLEDLQTEKDSLLADLEHTRDQAYEAAVKEDESRVQLAALEEKFIALQQDLAKVQSDAKEAQFENNSQLTSLQKEKKQLLCGLEKAQDKIEKLQLEKEALLSELEQARTESKIASDGEKELTEQIASLKSELITTQQKLKQTKTQAEKIQSQLESKLSDLQEKNDSLALELQDAHEDDNNKTMAREKLANQPISDQKNVQSEQYEPSVKQSEVIIPPRHDQKNNAIILPDENIDSLIEDTTIQGSNEADTEESCKPEMMQKQLQAANLPRAADKIIFSKALCDIENGGAAVRADAVKAISGISHELSAKVLVAHMKNERTPQVRAECVKGLAELDMKEGLGAIEKALSDEAACIRLSAVWGIYRLMGSESAIALVRMFSDEDEGVRRRAITCIGWMGGQIEAMDKPNPRHVIAALIKNLDGTSESIKKAAISTLEAITGKRMIESSVQNQQTLESSTSKWQKWWKEELLR